MSEKESRLSIAEAFIRAKKSHVKEVFQFSSRGLTILKDKSESLSRGSRYFTECGISPNNFYLEINPNGKDTDEIINVRSVIPVEGGADRFSFIFKPGCFTVDVFTDMVLLDTYIEELHGFVTHYPVKNITEWVNLLRANKFKNASPKCVWDVTAQEVIKLEDNVFYGYNKTTFGKTWEPLTIAGRHFEDGVYFPIYLKKGCSDEVVSKIKPYWLSEGNYII